MADEEVAQINEQASQLSSEAQPTPAKPSKAPPADPTPQPAPAKKIQKPETTESEYRPLIAAPKVQIAPAAPMFKPIIASPVPHQVAPSPALSVGHTNGFSNGFSNGHTNGHTNGFTNGTNDLSTPTPTPISNQLQITLNKEMGQHWGFRMGGGKELRLPLSVNKLQQGGLAEKGGIEVGDIVFEINSNSTAEMTHDDAMEAIKNAGNTCMFSLTRSESAKKQMIKPLKPRTTLGDFTVAQPNGGRPALSTPVAATCAMRNVALNTLSIEQAETCFTEEVIAETMSSHAEVVMGNALGVNFHKFEPKYEHLAHSSVFLLLLEEETRKGKTMEVPQTLKPLIFEKKIKGAKPKAPSPLPPPKTPTPLPKEPTPPPKEPTPPPEEPTPPKEATPPPQEPIPQPESAAQVAVEPEQPQVEASPENGAPEQPATNGNGSIHEEDPELVAIEQAAKQPPPASPAPEPQAPQIPEPQAPQIPEHQYFQQQHQLTKKQKELLEYQSKHKMHLEECRRRINKAQKTIYAPTITPPRKEENSMGMIFELPKAGSRYKPSLPLTPIAFLGNAFPTKEEPFKPFKAKPLPIYVPAGPKPLGKPACAVQCVIPMKWTSPSKLINGQPYKQTATVHQVNPKDLEDQDFLPPIQPKPEVPPYIQKPVAHPLQPVPDPPYRVPSPPLIISEDEIAELMSSHAEVIVGHTLGVNFQRYTPGFEHLKNSEVYRLVHNMDDEQHEQHEEQ